MRIHDALDFQSNLHEHRLVKPTEAMMHTYSRCALVQDGVLSRR